MAHSQNPQVPPKRGPHYRVPWRSIDPKNVIGHTNYLNLLGQYKTAEKEAKVKRDRYDRAKTKFDVDAALEIIDECISDDAIDRVIDDLERTQKPPKIAFPHPEWDAGTGEFNPNSRPTNALPFAFAQVLAEILDCEVDLEIGQIARPGRKKLTNLQRFVWQAKFEGDVSEEHAYILADDMFHFGGTLAMLRSYIVENGGVVISATSLATKDGAHKPFPVEDNTLGVLRSLYSADIDEFWREEIGHETVCLTEIEGAFLSEWGSKLPDLADGDTLLQRLREEINKTKAT
ncbi:hypothetical protein [Roseibium sp.]|uniref:hypothetical protein n=1 Tax=Roseibium sp. TaxID=1936156 RepID=UPI003A982846